MLRWSPYYQLRRPNLGRRAADLRRGWLRQEPVSHASHRQQMPRMSRVRLDILAQPNHEIVNGPCVGVFAQPPNLFQNGLARHDPSTFADEMAQQFGLHQREAKDLAVGS